jgi:hypothetical protein
LIITAISCRHHILHVSAIVIQEHFLVTVHVILMKSMVIDFVSIGIKHLLGIVKMLLLLHHGILVEVVIIHHEILSEIYTSMGICGAWVIGTIGIA